MIAVYMASGLLAAGICTDLICRRVPNVLIGIGLLTGCYLSVCKFGVQTGLLFFLRDVLWPVLLLFPVYLLGAIGAGDVKLIAALSAMTGGARIGSLILISFLIGAVIALIRLIKRRQLLLKCGRVFAHVTDCILSHEFSRYEAVEETGSHMHFTVCIGLAYIMSGFLEVVV